MSVNPGLAEKQLDRAVGAKSMPETPRLLLKKVLPRATAAEGASAAGGGGAVDIAVTVAVVAVAGAVAAAAATAVAATATSAGASRTTVARPVAGHVASATLLGLRHQPEGKLALGRAHGYDPERQALALLAGNGLTGAQTHINHHGFCQGPAQPSLAHL
eukprot:13553609-Alexandrium_andersonii.AAC.1